MELQSSFELEVARYIVEKTRYNLLLTGSAGSGKTSFLKEIVRSSGKRKVVLAPTGVAAVNAGGETIHSFFKIPFGPYIPGTDNPGFLSFRDSRAALIRSLELVIIDEVSMLRADLLDRMDYELRRIRRKDTPFGGVQLLLIGDFRQLPPVVKGDESNILEEFYPSNYFFESVALKKIDYYCIELKTIYRQRDEKYAGLLERIRDNKATAEDLRMLNARYRPGFIGDGKHIRIVTHNYQVDRLNSAEMENLPGTAYTFDACITGNYPSGSCPTDKRLTLKRGARVMFVRNDPGGRFVNGSLGTVTHVERDSIIVKVDAGEEILLERMEWKSVRYSFDRERMLVEPITEGVFMQYPLKPAWAITVHKSQGLTFEKAMIDVHTAFIPGQAYVALSRCRSLRGIILNARVYRSVFKTDSLVDDFLSRSHVDIDSLARQVGYSSTGTVAAGIPKRAGGDSAKISFDLYNDGYSIAEIASMRSLTENTIQTHLIHYVRQGQIDVMSLVDPDDLEGVRSYKLSHPGQAPLREIYDHFNGRISYPDLKFALAFLEGES